MNLPNELRSALEAENPSATSAFNEDLGYADVEVKVNRNKVFGSNQPLAAREMNEIAARLYLVEARAMEHEFAWREYVVKLEKIDENNRPIQRFTTSDATLLEPILKLAILENGFAIENSDTSILIHRGVHRIHLAFLNGEVEEENLRHYETKEANESFVAYFNKVALSSKLPRSLIPRIIWNDIQLRLTPESSHARPWQSFKAAASLLFDRRSIGSLLAVLALLLVFCGFLQRLTWGVSAIPLAVAIVHCWCWIRTQLSPLKIKVDHNFIDLHDCFGRSSLPLEPLLLDQSEVNRFLAEPKLERLLSSPWVNRNVLVSTPSTPRLEIIELFLVVVAWALAILSLWYFLVDVF
jgi:hypothetical protein